VLLSNRWAQASGWLIIGITEVRADAVPGVGQGREIARTFVSPGQVLSRHRSIVHEGSGFAVTKAAVERRTARPWPKQRDHVPRDGVSGPEVRASMLETASAIDFPVKAHG